MTAILDFIRKIQLDAMLFMSGVCAILVLMTVMTRSLSPKRRRILALLELAAMLLLIFDRYAYIYRGDVSRLGYWMVRVSNFMVYFLTLYIVHAITLYLFELLRSRGVAELPRRLLLCELLFFAGVALLIVSQFTGLYYTFDEFNRYQRAPANVLCYVLPLLISFILISVVVKFRKSLSRPIVVSLLLNTIVPIVAAVIQLFTYGVSLTNMTVVGMAIILYGFALSDLIREVEQAREREISHFKEEQKKEHDLFMQTAGALVNAIDAKDKYTNGHSHRVAEYSEKIAREAGKPEEYCEEVYFTALLHDVGKIGVSDAIINKEGKLTDEEFSVIKQHPAMGSQILKSIEQSPYLRTGANYHHERYDGKGYPQGLKGEEIPEMARIIAVADAYDAMTSTRSYRDTLPQSVVRGELVKGRGKQFDPDFADIMIHLMDEDTAYNMREKKLQEVRDA